MKLYALMSLSFFCFPFARATTTESLHPPRVSTEPITIVWPPEGMTLSAENEFVFGNVADPNAHFEINGTTVSVYRDGGFLAWLPISAGTFTFRASLALSSQTATAQRHIFVPPSPIPLPNSPLAIDRSSLWPKEDLELRTGDWWTARMRATPHRAARVRVAGGAWHDMREVSPRGFYEANVYVAPGEKFGPTTLEYQIGSGWFARRVRGTARVCATTKTPTVAIAKPNPAGFINVKTAPNGGFLIFPPAGTRMLVDGRDGSFLRVSLGGLSGWVEAKDVELSTSAPPPRAEIGDIDVSETAAGASIRISLSAQVPFNVNESDDLNELTVRLFDSTGHTNTVTFNKSPADFVDQVRWRQEATGVVAVTVRLKPRLKLWGWNVRDESPSSLRLDLRRPPRVSPRRPLEGLKVMLDPGHMPSAPGAIGPLGTKEMDANYAIAKAAAELLRQKGAIPLLTRLSPSDEVSLVDRPKQALERGADLFVSIHNNALPDGSNPFSKPHGFSVYYYHAHSLGLAHAVHGAYAKAALVPDEGLQWDNLLVARLSAMPAILVENAYLVFPEQEALLDEPAFREKLARALTSGLESFALEAGE